MSLRAARAVLPALALVGLLAAATPAVAVPPTFANDAAPNGLGTDAGEPSIGSNWKSGKVFVQAGLQTLRVDYSTTPPTWQNVASNITSTTSLDPILYTEKTVGRTFVSQLSAGCSLMAFTDDDGASWFQNPIGCGVAAGADHQTVGGGPFAPGLVGPTGTYPRIVYYCAQAVATAQCNVSRDGGLSFGPGVPIYNTTQCGGLHGHVKVGPDGTAYVPNADCGGQAAVVVSRDNGMTWTVDKIPGSSSQDESDPSVAVDDAKNVYVIYDDNRAGGAESHPMVAVKKPGGAWSAPVDVGAAAGIKNTQFPVSVAGDGGRAAVAFLGTPTAGDDQAAAFAGVWHLYVAETLDAGATWSLTDATPSDPVQRGCIWLGGGSNTCRNLLDFNDATIDSTGRILVAYADGCTDTCVGGGANTHSALATIARQTGGDDLIAAR